MILAAQYYRPPFPRHKYWHDDMRAMRAAGLNTAYLWVCWGWVEPEPGRFEFADYDELIEEAGNAGLKVVLNTIAEVQPFWVPREIPSAQMIDHTGRPVLSSPRGECMVGLTPGGCTDDRVLREAMGSFFTTTAERYRGADALHAWDLWNETRWAVQADAFVCYCDNTLKAFRGWLQGRYGDLNGLSQEWGRRYASWEDVMPGKLPGRIYTDLMEYQAFLTDRSGEHMRFRYDTVRAADPDHLIVAHAGTTANIKMPIELEQELSRGDDWDYTDFLDGFGASLFPLWMGDSVLDYGARVESGRSAAQDKLFWVGELQGSSARSGFEAQASVPGDLQQRWLWSAIGRGAAAVNFWCWRDEVFSREASGFGLCGNDGEADSRLAALRVTGDFLEANAELMDAYHPAQARVGVIFEPDGYRMDWAQFGTGSRQAARSLWGYLVGLEKLQIPYDVVESRHHDHLDQYRLIIMPWPLIVNPGLAAKLADWVAAGGTLLVESEADAYDALGFYRYPQDRPFANGLGITSKGRRANMGAELTLTLGEFAGQLQTAAWVEPMDPAGAEVLANSDLGALAVRTRIGQGQVFAIGTLAGLAEDAAVSAGFGSVRSSANAMAGPLSSASMAKRRVLPDLAADPLAPSDFTRFLSAVVSAADAGVGLRCSLADGAVVQWRYGRAQDAALLFVINYGPAVRLTFTGAPIDADAGAAVDELTGDGQQLPVRSNGDEPEFDLDIAAGGYAVVRWRRAAGGEPVDRRTKDH